MGREHHLVGLAGHQRSQETPSGVEVNRQGNTFGEWLKMSGKLNDFNNAEDRENVGNLGHTDKFDKADNLPTPG